MAVAAEPKPLTHALPGGRPGAVVRLHPLLVAMQAAPPAIFSRPRGPLPLARGLLARRSRWVRLPVPAFLVEHPTAGAILIDTGFHASVASDPRDSLGPVGGRVLDIEMTADQAVPAQLEARGIDPASVRTVVMTHLHYDHASGVSQFPAATFVVSEREWRAAGREGFRGGYRPRQFDHAFDWRTLDDTGADGDSFASFGRCFDLFADGSVRIVSTPGHSAGHQSVILRLPGREALLTGDAAYRTEAIVNGELQLLFADEHRYRRSVGEIRRFVEQTPDALVICGHDPQGFAALDPVYG
jgi:N-acyl homoserine lactone hydrolase